MALKLGEPKLKEKDIEKMVLDFFSYKGLFVWKNPSAGFFDPQRRTFRRHTSPYAINGTPDIFLVKRKRDGGSLVVAVEVKSKDGRLSDSQKQFKERYESYGGLYFLVRSLDDAKNVLDAIAEV